MTTVQAALSNDIHYLSMYIGSSSSPLFTPAGCILGVGLVYRLNLSHSTFYVCAYLYSQIETFPNQYGLCECTDTLCTDVFALCGTSFSLQVDLFSGATPANPISGPSQVTVPGYTVWSFNGENTISQNWLEISSSTKSSLLSVTDDFTISFWIRVGSASNAQYILGCELGTSRYFSMYDAGTARMILYYFRDTLPGLSQAQDDGYDSQVALSFYYDSAIFPNGLRDNQWHFVALTVDYPVVTFSIDGYELRPTRGNYRDRFTSQVLLNRDGSIYDMPAPILTKSASVIDSISCKLGGSARGNSFSLLGEMRQPTVTPVLSSENHRCIASCNEYIEASSSVSIVSQFQTFYNPVLRRLEFSSTTATSDSDYTLFVQSLIFYSNGFIPPEEQRESRRIDLRISDGVDFGNTAQVTITGRSNQFDPILDVNGDQVPGIDYSVTFTEGQVTEVPIISNQAFFMDQDIDPQVVEVRVTLTNNLQSVFVEHLRFEGTVPSVLSVQGSDSSEIVITATDPDRVTPNNFITVLISIRYRNIANEPVDTPRIIEFSVSDGARTNNPPARTTINVVTFDDPPNLDLSSTQAGINAESDYTEADPPTFIIPDATIQDEDSNMISEARARIEEVFDVGSERLIIDLSLASAAGISCTPSNCEGTDIQLSGQSSISNYQDLLRSLQYVNDLQATDLPNLRDRRIFVVVSDGVSTSDPTATITLNFRPLNPRVVIQLDAPNQDYEVEFTEAQQSPISLVSLVRIVDTSILTLESVVVSIRPNLPAGVVEDQELLMITSTANLSVSVEINTALKRITFSQRAPVDEYVNAISRVLYFNGEDEPYPITRFVDFLVNPGGGAPNDTATTNITIRNVNDMSPVCDPTTVVVPVREDTADNTLIYTLMATDGDAGTAGDITYSLTSGDSSLFSVNTVAAGNEQNGELYLIGDLDRETTDSYTLQVTVCDQGTPTFCCTYNITINVTDANDNVPVFERQVYNVSVTENNVTDILRFTISDRDIGINADIVDLQIDTTSFNQLSGCIGNFQTRVDAGVPILATTGVDFETVQLCSFTVIATDGGNPPQQGRANVAVTIVNQDDFPPEFTTELFEFFVEEENQFPMVIGALTASDVDSPPNSLEFSPMDIGPGQFSINPASGNVSILFEGNRNIQTNYTFTVTVTDPAGNFDTANVLVEIRPINNDPPVLDLNVTDTTSINARTPVTFVEEGPAVSIVIDPLITDPDELPFNVALIQVRVANSGSSSNELLSVNANPSQYTVISCPSSSPPGAFCVQPAFGSVEPLVNDLLQSFLYRNTEDEISSCRDDLYPCEAGALSRTILFLVNDGRFNSNESEAYVVFQTVNDAPVVDLDSGTTGVNYRTNFREGEGAISIVNPGQYTITDDDNTNLQSLSCILTNPQDGSDEFLRLNTTATALPSSLSVSLSADSYSISFTGSASIADYVVALGMVWYNSITTNPDITVREIQCVVSDGMLNSTVATTFVDFRVVNQNPRLDLDSTSTDDYIVNFVEEGGPVSLTNAAVLTDADNTNMQELTVTLVGGAGPQEVLTVNQALIVPSLTSSYAFPELVVQGVASISTYQAIINSVTYNNLDSEIANVNTRMAEFVVTDAAGGSSEPVATNITITPVDDNPPVFQPSDVYTFSVPENSNVNTLVGTLTVTDADQSPEITVPLFSIISSTPGFGSSDFRIINNVLQPFEGQLLVNDALDFDAKATTYSLVVRASSGPFNITALVTVNINNLPDIQPEFTNCPTEFSVIENEVVSTLILPGCTAVDPDGLDTITYSISGNIVGGIRLIDINTATGALSVFNSIDREVVGVSFEVVITASDSTLSSTRNSTIVINGENEFPPAFTAASYTTMVTENAAPSSSPLISVVASDQDEQPDIMADPDFVSRITFSFMNPTTVFSINSTTGEIYQLEVVDREQESQYVLQVVASDNDPTPLPRSAIATVFINVENVNDEPPAFVALDDTIVVSEAFPAAPNMPFYTIDFSDPDANANLQVTLSPTSTEFLLNSATGELSLNVRLDADSPPRSYTYNITLTDLNTAPAYASARSVAQVITILVEDSNDNIPQFTTAIFEGNVTENQPAGTVVLQVTATDGDYGFDTAGARNGYNILRYSFLNAPANTFAINESTGVVTKVTELDREDQAEFELTVVVRDSPVSGVARTNQAIVRITILDVNEFRPQVDPNQYFISLPEDTQANTPLDTYVRGYWRTGSK